MKKLFQKGDVVRLKSGGPDMTVVDYLVLHDITAAFRRAKAEPSVETEIVNITYFNGNKICNNKFNQDLLEYSSNILLIGKPR